MPLKNKLALLCLTAACCAATGTYAAQRSFSFAGLNIPNVNFSSPTFANETDKKNFAGALGFKLSPRWRVEGELSYRRDDSYRAGFGGDESPMNDLRSWAGLVNLYYDFDTSSRLQPFIGAGAGYAKTLGAEDASSQGALVAQVGGGVNFRASPNLVFTGAYHYLENAPASLDGYDSDFGGHELHFSVHYDLPFKPAPRPRPQN